MTTFDTALLAAEPNQQLPGDQLEERQLSCARNARLLPRSFRSRPSRAARSLGKAATAYAAEQGVGGHVFALHNQPPC